MRAAHRAPRSKRWDLRAAHGAQRSKRAWVCRFLDGATGMVSSQPLTALRSSAQALKVRGGPGGWPLGCGFPLRSQLSNSKNTPSVRTMRTIQNTSPIVFAVVDRIAGSSLNHWIAKKNTGVSRMPNSVTPIMPLNTAVPRACRISAPAPSAITRGNTPRINANDVIKIGRKRSRQASVVASNNGFPSVCSWRANSTIRMAFLLARTTIFRFGLHPFVRRKDRFRLTR